jgi:hypothetical protein
MVNITMTSIENKIEVTESSYIIACLYILKTIVVHRKVQAIFRSGSRGRFRKSANPQLIVVDKIDLLKTSHIF